MINKEIEKIFEIVNKDLNMIIDKTDICEDGNEQIIFLAYLEDLYSQCAEEIRIARKKIMYDEENKIK